MSEINNQHDFFKEYIISEFLKNPNISYTDFLNRFNSVFSELFQNRFFISEEYFFYIISTLQEILGKKENNNPVICCLVGESGSGKTTLSQYLSEKYPDKFNMIISRTTRAPRPNDDKTYITEKEYFQYFNDNPKEILTHTKYGDNYYITLKNDIVPGKINLYIVDQFGIVTLYRKRLFNQYKIYNIRLKRNQDLVINSGVDIERYQRSIDSYTLSNRFYDLVINNNFPSIKEFLINSEEKFNNILPVT